MAHGEHTAEQRHGTTPSSADHSNGGERVVGKRRFRGGPMVALSRTTVCRNSPAAFPRFQGHAGMQFTHSSALRHHKEVALFAWFFAKSFARVFATANSLNRDSRYTTVHEVHIFWRVMVHAMDSMVSQVRRFAFVHSQV